MSKNIIGKFWSIIDSSLVIIKIQKYIANVSFLLELFTYSELTILTGKVQACSELLDYCFIYSYIYDFTIIIICLYAHKDNMYTYVLSVCLHACTFWKIQKDYISLQLILNVQYS